MTPSQAKTLGSKIQKIAPTKTGNFFYFFAECFCQKSLGHMPKKISIFFGRDPAIFEKRQ